MKKIANRPRQRHLAVVLNGCARLALETRLIGVQFYPKSLLRHPGPAISRDGFDYLEAASWLG
jgi:hypothetical protein